MLKGGTNYTMIRRAIFGKVHGHGVKEIWLISQFPAKHTGGFQISVIIYAKMISKLYTIISNKL